VHFTRFKKSLKFPFLRGPLISPFAKDRVTGLIASAEEDGGKILLDGRNMKTPEYYPYGNFVGPTIIQGDTSMRCYQ
jgi:malonate-semialdehyde dehydrogenase (acetylating)/methylmalonate-semialdehyde dehydrogenase